MQPVKRFLIVGATSGIAREVCRQLAGKGHPPVLAGRNREELDRLSADLEARFRVPIPSLHFDAGEPGEKSLIEESEALAGEELAGILLAVGTMSDQDSAFQNTDVFSAMAEVNYTAPVALLNQAASRFEKRNRGILAAVTSVAGDRGRQSNFLYGSTKAALSTYLAGLRHRMHGTGVTVIDIRPGMVDTAMTFGLVNPKSPLVASPQRVAKDIVSALLKEKSGVVYTPWFWRWVMTLIRWLPAPLFHRTQL